MNSIADVAGAASGQRKSVNHTQLKSFVKNIMAVNEFTSPRPNRRAGRPSAQLPNQSNPSHGDSKLSRALPVNQMKRVENA